MMLLTLACALGSVYWGIDLAQTYGLRPGDGGQLAPLSTRLAWGISVAALGCSFAFGMWVYGRCYVSRMEFDEQAKKLYVYTPRLFGSRRQEFKLADVLKRTFHRGKANYGDLSVDAPWQSIRVAGRRLPLILDLQGEFPNPKLLERVFGWNRENL
jgi:hypothetical protein